MLTNKNIDSYSSLLKRRSDFSTTSVSIIHREKVCIIYVNTLKIILLLDFHHHHDAGSRIWDEASLYSSLLEGNIKLLCKYNMTSIQSCQFLIFRLFLDLHLRNVRNNVLANKQPSIWALVCLPQNEFSYIYIAVMRFNWLVTFFFSCFPIFHGLIAFFCPDFGRIGTVFLLRNCPSWLHVMHLLSSVIPILWRCSDNHGLQKGDIQQFVNSMKKYLNEGAYCYLTISVLNKNVIPGTEV